MKVGILVTQFSGKWEDGSPKSVNERLNELGEQGWELVAMCPVALRERDNTAGTTSWIMFTFKRPKEH